MTYFAMARRFRPQSFSEVAAQSHITETLQRALENDRVTSAYLFAGPRGSGKTTVARLLAKAVNCDARSKGEPCTTCGSCTTIAAGRSLDVLEIDGASNNSVDDVRELRENVRYAASAPGKRKVYIIDEVHMLSTGAFNALLKTLEEPPAHVLFVFATTEPRKVPQTILSRCQRFDFRRLQTEEIRERLQLVRKKEKVDIDDAALFLIAKRADGSLRDGLSLLDQVISSTDGRVGEETVAEVLGLVREETYLDLTEAILDRDTVRALELLHASLRAGADPSGFALGLVEHLRNLLLLSVDESLRGSVQLGDAHMKRAEELAQRFRTEDLLHLLNRTAAVYEDTRSLSSPAVVLEAAMVELPRFESRVVLSEVLERLERGSGGGTDSGSRSAPRRGSTGRGGKAPKRTSSRGAAPERAPGAGLDLSTPVAGRGTSAGGADPASASGPGIGAPVAAGGPPMLPGSVRAPTPAGAPPDVVAQAGCAGATAVVAGPLDLETIRARWSDF
ncbi:MAG: DNA polymerase III subunit gamma/tau, partial [Candidatus Krumholzibacteriia bacterium]